MYQQFFGLRELPFELTPNPKFLYLTRQHREALSTLEYGLSTGKGVTVLVGEAGTGKTTLLHAALQSEQCRHVVCVYMTNPTLTRTEFVEMLSAQFGLSARASASKTAMLRELEAILRDRRARGQLTALVIDEAQSLSSELLEEIRLLANTETATEKLLSVVLAGQPELRDRLNEVDLRQLKQRVTLRCEIRPFTVQETAAYIAGRIKMSGGDAARLFTREAVMLIHERSGGIPRTISVMCDNALLTGFGMGRQPITYDMVLEVARDFDLTETRWHDSTAVPGQDPLAAVTFAPSVEEPPSPAPSNLAVVPKAEVAGEPVEESAGGIEPGESPAVTSKPRFSIFGGR